MISTVNSNEVRPSDQLHCLGRQVKKIRKAAGLTQEDLSERCNIYRTYLSRIEAGEANPTVLVLLTLAKQLNVAVGDLFGE